MFRGLDYFGILMIPAADSPAIVGFD